MDLVLYYQSAGWPKDEKTPTCCVLVIVMKALHNWKSVYIEVLHILVECQTSKKKKEENIFLIRGTSAIQHILFESPDAKRF